jgi:hypothetical protein
LKDIESEVTRQGRRKEVAPKSKDVEEVGGEMEHEEGRPEQTAPVEPTPQLDTAAVTLATPSSEPQETSAKDRDGELPQGSTSTARPIEVSTDQPNDSWESFVVEFQESMQVYRAKVRKFKDDGEQDDVDVWTYERHVRELGLRLLRIWRSAATEDDVKVRAKQLLKAPG